MSAWRPVRWPHENQRSLQFGAAAPVRRTRAPIYLLSDRAPVLERVRRNRAARSSAGQQRRSDPTPAVPVCPCAVLPEPVLLLRLQSHHHPRSVPRRQLPGPALPGDRPDRGAVRSRPRGDPAALRRRDSQLPVSCPIARGRGYPASPVPFFRQSPARHLDRTRSAFHFPGRRGGTGDHRFQSSQPRRPGFRSAGATGGQSDPERRADRCRHRRLPRQRFPLGQCRSDLRFAEAECRMRKALRERWTR